MTGISPLWNNVLFCTITFIYVFSLVALMDFLVKRYGLPQDISRKITHIGAGTLIIFIPFFDDGHWTKYLNVGIYVLWIVLLTLKGLTAGPDDEAVRTMTRTGNPHELLKGPLFFVIVGTICGTFFYKSFEGVVAMAVLGWGDGVAPLIGSRYGKMKYAILSPKSIEGSLSVFLFGFGAALFFVWWIIPTDFNLIRICFITLIATIAEAVSPKEVDNFLIPGAVILASQFI
ncbi:MAG: phosphatidate cytidylyltransferase [Chloroherpetonaceae bacterium]|nr:phosphatidate cytidylyltransferase [Chloroherpetonaceae bacterium]